VTASWLLKRIALQLGVESPSEDKLTLLGQLYQRLVKIYESGKKAVVLIDEAQMLATRELMEEFRGLLNLEVPERKLLSLIFFGLPEIEQNLKLDPPLAQRVAVKYRLDHLNADSTEAYIKHRLRLAGASRMPFTPEAVRAVHRFSGGTPRVINTLCDNALFEGYIARAPMIDHQMIARVALDLGLEGGPTPEEPKPVSAPPPRVSSPGPARPKSQATAAVPPQVTAAAESKAKAMDLGEIDRYLAGLAKPS
jgi:type II secretory pathway predicted ATPase ExeA